MIETVTLDTRKCYPPSGKLRISPLRRGERSNVTLTQAKRVAKAMLAPRESRALRAPKVPRANLARKAQLARKATLAATPPPRTCA